MKKFFSKLPVLITFAVVTVLMLALTIGLSVRPISYGMTYNGTMTMVEGTTTTKVDSSFKFKNKNEAVMVASFAGVETQEEYWYYRNGHKIFMVQKEITQEEFDAMIEEAKANKEQWDELWKSEQVINVNAFTVSGGSEAEGLTYKATAGGAVALTVVLSIITLVGVAGTTLSVLYFVKNKKSAKVAE